MKLPGHTELSIETAHAIAARHGFQAATVTRFPDTGIFNAVYLLGEDLVDLTRFGGHREAWGREIPEGHVHDASSTVPTRIPL